MSITCDYKFIRGKNVGLECGRNCSKYSELNKCNIHGVKYYKKVKVVELPSELVDMILTKIPRKKLIKINKYYNNYKYYHFCECGGSQCEIKYCANKKIWTLRIENPNSIRKSQYKYACAYNIALRVLRINGQDNYFYIEPIERESFEYERDGVRDITIPKKIFEDLLSVRLYSINRCCSYCKLNISFD